MSVTRERAAAQSPKRRTALTPRAASAIRRSRLATVTRPSLELPLGRSARSRAYRAFEMLPAILSLGIPLTIVVVAIFDANAAAWLVLIAIVAAALRGIRAMVDTVRGYRALRSAEAADWAGLNAELESAILRAASGGAPRRTRALVEGAILRRHRDLLDAIDENPAAYPLPSEVVHAVIVAAYNEPYEVVEQSIRALTRTTHPERLVVLFAYEARGGAAMRATAARLEQEYGYRFRAFVPSEHPDDLGDEIPGKGGNLTWAGHRLEQWTREHGIEERVVVVTSLDCDNKPHPRYFDAVTYEFVRAVDRQRASFQPISLFTGNIWHAPAPMRLIASSNSMWNLISTVRPFGLRNFASHAQPLAALRRMGFWSRRTIVEDGHQYWRSYFHFDGRYRVIPIRVPILQDAVLTDSFPRTLIAQFTQLARWAYGASDIPYVGVRLFSADRRAPFWRTLAQFLLLVESHVSLAALGPLVAIGAWLPIIVIRVMRWIEWAQLSGVTRATHWVTQLGLGESFIDTLPSTVTWIERAALPGLFVTILFAFLLLPKRPPEFGATRTLGMLLQWVLVPVTAIAYSAASSMLSQTRLLLGRYRERFEVTEKVAAPGA